MAEERRFIQMALRLPPELHSALKALAEHERRSLHAQILVLLEEALDAREQQRGKEAA